MGSRRAARIAERIREDASQIILYELRDPRLGLITITRVDVSADLHHAKIYFSVFGDEAARRTALRGLESAQGLVRSRIARGLGLREAPTIAFEFDPTIEKAIEVSKLIDRVAAEFHDGEEAAQEGTEAEEEGGEEEK